VATPSRSVQLSQSPPTTWASTSRQTRSQPEMLNRSHGSSPLRSCTPQMIKTLQTWLETLSKSKETSRLSVAGLPSNLPRQLLYPLATPASMSSPTQSQPEMLNRSHGSPLRSFGRQTIKTLRTSLETLSKSKETSRLSVAGLPSNLPRQLLYPLATPASMSSPTRFMLVGAPHLRTHKSLVTLLAVSSPHFARRPSQPADICADLPRSRHCPVPK
jgi:hypothetical protein